MRLDGFPTPRTTPIIQSSLPALNRFARKLVFSSPNPPKQAACPPQSSGKQRPAPWPPHTRAVRLCSPLPRSHRRDRNAPVSPHRHPRALTRASCSEALTGEPSVREVISVLHVCLQSRGHQTQRHVTIRHDRTALRPGLGTAGPCGPGRPYIALPGGKSGLGYGRGGPTCPSMTRRGAAESPQGGGAPLTHGTAQRKAAPRRPRSPTPAGGSRAARLGRAPTFPARPPPSRPEAAARTASRLPRLANRGPTHRQPRPLRRPARRNAGLTRPQQAPRPTPPSWPRGPPRPAPPNGRGATAASRAALRRCPRSGAVGAPGPRGGRSSAEGRAAVEGFALPPFPS